MSPSAMPAYLEIGSKRVFACAVDWPGWCRSGKSEESALEALENYANRYSMVATEAGIKFPKKPPTFEVVERVVGSANTDFGAPGSIARLDKEPLTKAESNRLCSLMGASWKIFDEVMATAPPTLRKGPRGGGRDRDPIGEHVVAAEASYARKIGIRLPQPSIKDVEALSTFRQAVTDIVRNEWKNEPVIPGGWPLRYTVRRLTWHVLDHAWEIQDKS